MLKWIHPKNQDKDLVEDKITAWKREDKKLKHLIEEMVETERRYLEDLEEVKNPVLKKNLAKRMFRCVRCTCP